MGLPSPPPKPHPALSSPKQSPIPLPPQFIFVRPIHEIPIMGYLGAPQGKGRRLQASTLHCRWMLHHLLGAGWGQHPSVSLQQPKT